MARKGPLPLLIGLPTDMPIARSASGACRMLSVSAALRTDGGIAPPEQQKAKLANVTQMAGWSSIALDSTVARSPFACAAAQL